MKDLKFANESLLFWLCLQNYEQRPKYRGLMGREPINMWPYLCRFVTHFPDFAHLEVFHNALSGGPIIGLRLHGLGPFFQGRPADFNMVFLRTAASAEGASCVFQCKFATVYGFYVAVAAFS